MIFAFVKAHWRVFHISVMVSIVVFDVLLLPIYFILERNWYDRMILHEDILSFGVWMHFMLILSLYVLYAFQILSARRLWKGPDPWQARVEHRSQGKGILIVRALVIITGAMLIESGAS